MTLAIDSVNHSVTHKEKQIGHREEGPKGSRLGPIISAQLQNPLAMIDMITVMTISTKESNNGQYPIQSHNATP